MSTSGNMRQTRSRTAASVPPSAVGSNAGSDTTSRPAASQAGSRAGGRDRSPRKTRGSRQLDTYGSPDSDRAAAQQRRQEMLQNVGSAFGRAFDGDAQPAMPSRMPSPNDQFQQVETSEIIDNTRYGHDVTGNDLAGHDLDGATARHTPANNFARTPRQNLRYIAANSAQAEFDFGKVAKKWLFYLGLTLFALACLVALSYYSFLLLGLDRFTRDGRQYGDLVKGQESLVKGQESLVKGQESLNHRDEGFNHRMNSFEEKLLSLHDTKEYSIYGGGKASVDWFHPSNMAVTISKYTSPEKMRKVGGWFGLFQKQVAFNAVPNIVGPFDGVEKMWCAPSDHGQAQITVLLAKKIIPHVLIVEQLDTKDTTPYWQSFPDQIELWASFDETAREPIITFFPSMVPGAQTQGRKLDVEALPKSFKMLGRWHYELHNRRRKQIFDIAVDQPTNMVSFRVNSNHGDVDQICLHKLRLYGTLPSQD